jgi:peptidoglycan lytic transglycosylase
MRTILFSALTALTLGLLTLTPASAANAPWKCIGPAVACADSKPSWRSRESRSNRNYERRAKRSYGKRSRREARYEAPSRQRTSTSTSRKSYGGGSHGVASYYWQGTRTASGARYNPDGLTAAHRTLPFGTKVRVTNKRNGRSVVVTINDRGPFIRGRIIDLSRGAAGVIGMRSAGLAPVSVEVLGRSG